ncbi:MAG TPA: nitrilase-related carbon-nitrogen hydrolase [Methanoregulaceae archaeon]|nr:nitrilase-related carbon-nitrogen hydrolase [Methanoregulaceae archaeon]HPD10253.1 nitrilase-related carbon-nitrogen hydrolase [Methanoregulaceae archaeon]HRT14640.1 nitrilase-related carbon-nitrogen hydrolase [Methanoregulaceae archaeon]HRU30211.1 nitrilase-related carbon-nitrogen hydrolase [Methanoregulaceae archaeon]
MKIFGVQMRSVWEDPAATLAKAEPFVHSAARQGGLLACFPEQFATGWDPESLLHIQDRTGPIVSSLKELARDAGIAILGSFREASNQGPHNVCIVVDNDGEELASYAKSHLFSPAREGVSYVPGTWPGTFTLDGMLCGIAICYDLRFSGLFSAYARKNVQAMIVPAAWPASRIGHWELLIRARAVEYQMYVVGVNTIGTTPVDSYNGHSIAADPLGTIIAEAGSAEIAFPVSLDRDYVERVREEFPVAGDQNPQLYSQFNDPGSG